MQYNPWYSLPPHGGSGLKFETGVRLISELARLPPHGGSGLKFNQSWTVSIHISVSLHTEGVDWNSINPEPYLYIYLSPSTRREWIEITMIGSRAQWSAVSLHTEGVDWNLKYFSISPEPYRLPPHGGSGLKYFYGTKLYGYYHESPSTRREWIEIAFSMIWPLSSTLVSLHTEGVDWNTTAYKYFSCFKGSPSTRREWIEIRVLMNWINFSPGLPPHGGSGLKYPTWWTILQGYKSPSTRREWIEILCYHDID